jgi:hypothetical protein
VRQTQTAGFRNRAVSGDPVARGVWSGPACIADCQPSVGDTVSLLREPDAGNPPVRLCVQRRLARSAGDSPAKARARRLVAWMAGRRETNDLKPIDNAVVRTVASHRAAARANAQVAPKMRNPGGRARNRKGEGNIERRTLADATFDSGGVVAAAR